MRFVLASKSPARLATLRSAGVNPEVIVSGVDESQVTAASPAHLTVALAELKGRAVADQFHPDEPHVIVACDSVLEFEGVAYGKPRSPRQAVERWRTMRGRDGVLHTGHHVLVCDQRGERSAVRVASTVVHFACPTDEEIEAYVATGEPEHVAGAFTIDGYGGAYIAGIDGDPHNVVGISLPMLRQMLADLGVTWHDLWEDPRATEAS